MSPWRLALVYARRELRGGLKGFRVFLACLALGVAAIAGVGTLAEGVREGLRADARLLLGGDFHLTLTHREATPAQRLHLDATATVSRSAEMRAMARGPGDRTLVELKAVDGVYPLIGAVETEPALPLAEILAARNGVWGAAVDPALLGKLGIALGDTIAVGDTRYEVRAIDRREPDRGTGILTLGPRLLVALDSLPATGLVQPGSLIQYQYRVVLPQGSDPGAWIADLRQRFPDAGWRVRGVAEAAPGLQRFIDRVAMFLTLVGLTALLVGGVGVANAVRTYLDGKTATIATLKCLGAPARLIFAMYLVQILILSAVGIAIGLAVGAVIPALAAPLIAAQLPVAARLGIYPLPLLIAAAFGLLTALAFSLWPLARAREVPPAALFRDLIQPARRWPRPAAAIGTAAAVAALAALAIVTATDRILAAGFVVGALATFAIFRLAALGIAAAARRAPRLRQPALRLAVANLHRPGAPAASIVLSLGIGLSVLVLVAVVHANLARQVEERLPDVAPTFFFVDLQPDQVQAFDALMAGLPGVGEVKRVPSLRGRIARINGVPVEQAQIAPEAQWAVGSDRGLTYAVDPPAGTRIVAGQWWPRDYQGPPQISFDAQIAQGMGLKLGDTLTINILGREIEARIGSLRRIDWSSLGLNFTLVFAPGTLEAAPHTHIATAVVAAGQDLAVERAVTDRFPNVSSIRVREALATIEGVLTNLALASQATAAVTLIAGTLVLAGAVLASHRRRVYDAVVLKVLGATRRAIMAAFLIEFGLIGILTAAIASVVGAICAWVLMAVYMRVPFQVLPGAVLATAIPAVVAVILLGLAGTWRALGQRPAPLLRHA